MNIILLSGGGGRRLWPISDDIRAKQFLKLLKDEKGNAESMIQRTYRQIRTYFPNANIVIAASEKQADLIAGQLHEKVNLCLEPEKRDTFAAIALAVAYLHYELGAADTESVVICPVDSYVENDFFSYLYKLYDLSQNHAARLLMLGIQPTYPSSKYGYIIPEKMEDFSAVVTFEEKPDSAKAEELIKSNALWNAGVFACNIQYLLNIVRQVAPFADYHDLYHNYINIPKTSFDYAVAEKEENRAVLRCYAKWRDIGTWNALTDTMMQSSVGYALLDRQCSNVNVINETEMPVICVGCRDLIIAISNNGILVSDKTMSENIKLYVDTITATE